VTNERRWLKVSDLRTRGKEEAWLDGTTGRMVCLGWRDASINYQGNARKPISSLSYHSHVYLQGVKISLKDEWWESLS